MKLHRIVLLLAGLVLLAACEKLPEDELRGKWKPVYASGSYEDAVYTHYFNGPVDAHGMIPQHYVSREHPEVSYDGTLTISGLRFFREKGEDVFTAFEPDSPGKATGVPLRYKVEGGRLYRELPWYALTNGSDSREGGSGQFDAGTPLTFLDDDRVLIGDFTYERM